MKNPAKVASEALAELFVFAAVVEILEGSTAPRSDSGQKAASQIIAISKAQMQRQLKAHDRALKAAAPTQEPQAAR